MALHCCCQNIAGYWQSSQPIERPEHDHVEVWRVPCQSRQRVAIDDMDDAGDRIDMFHDRLEVRIVRPVESQAGWDDRCSIDQHRRLCRHSRKGALGLEGFEPEHHVGFCPGDECCADRADPDCRLNAATTLRETVDLADPSFEVGLGRSPPQETCSAQNALTADTDEDEVARSAHCGPPIARTEVTG